MLVLALCLVGWLEVNVPFQHKYGYIRDETLLIKNVLLLLEF